jgi:hypothetical protein
MQRAFRHESPYGQRPENDARAAQETLGAQRGHDQQEASQRSPAKDEHGLRLALAAATTATILPANVCLLVCDGASRRH